MSLGGVACGWTRRSSDTRSGTAPHDRFLASLPHAVLVSHVPSRELFKGIDERLETFAQAEGDEKELIRIVVDRNGSSVLKFRFQISWSVPRMRLP